MLAIPVFIIVAVFLGWLLVRLTLNALPLFAGIFVASVAHGSGAGWLGSVALGALCGVGVAAFGRSAATYVRNRTARVILGLAFAIPAGATAWFAVHGISGLLFADSAWGTISCAVTALVIGAAARQKIAVIPDCRA